MSRETFSLRQRVQRLLKAGWVPWVRPRTPGPGSEEVWARYDHANRKVVVRDPVTPAEGELVSDIMHNRYQGSYREDSS